MVMDMRYSVMSDCYLVRLFYLFVKMKGYKTIIARRSESLQQQQIEFDAVVFVRQQRVMMSCKKREL